MNALLKDVFAEQADAVGDPDIDLTAVVATGTRRNRRRRIATVVTAVAASAAVLAGGLTVVRQVTAEDAPPAGRSTGSPFADRRPTWAVGSTIHFGSDVLQVGTAVASFVQTDAGFVVTGANGVIYRASGWGTTQIGAGNKSRLLAADATGTVVGWVDARQRVPQFVLYDVAAGREVARTATGNRAGGSQVEVAAIDDGVAYLGASDGLHRWTIASGRDELLKPGAAPTFVQAAANGQIVWEHPAADAGNDLAVGSDVNAADPKHFEGWHANLSPGARYLLTDKADVVRLFDVRSGDELSLKFPGYTLIVPTQWNGDDTFFAVGFQSDESTTADLLTCSTSALTCKVAVGKAAPARTILIPLGVPTN